MNPAKRILIAGGASAGIVFVACSTVPVVGAAVGVIAGGVTFIAVEAGGFAGLGFYLAGRGIYHGIKNHHEKHHRKKHPHRVNHPEIHLTEPQPLSSVQNNLLPPENHLMEPPPRSSMTNSILPPPLPPKTSAFTTNASSVQNDVVETWKAARQPTENFAYAENIQIFREAEPQPPVTDVKLEQSQPALRM